MTTATLTHTPAAFFQRLRLRTRLLAGFGVVAALLVAIALVGTRELEVMHEQAEDLAGPALSGMRLAGQAQTDVLDYRRAILNYALGSAEVKQFETARIADIDARFAKAMAEYAQVIVDARERALHASIQTDFARLHELSRPILAAADAGDLAGVGSLLEGEHKLVRRQLHENLESLVAASAAQGETARATAEETFTSARTELGIASIAGLGLAIGLGLLITRSVSRQLGGDPAEAADAVRRIAGGDLDSEVRCDRAQASLLSDLAALRDRLRAFYDAQLAMLHQHEAGEIDHRIDATAFSGAYGRMAAAVNDNVGSHIAVKRQVIAITERYAIGDLSPDMPQLPGKKAAITAAMQATKQNLSRMNGDIGRLAQAAAHGDFSVRGPADSYQFAFREMVESLNQLMDSANRGLGDVGRVLQAVSEGDLTQRVDETHRGAFGELALNTNRSIDSIRGIVERITLAVDTINTAAREIASGNSDLSTRTESQAASLEETASSMEELTATIRANADNTRAAELVVQEATDGARRGGQVVGEVVQTMDRITQASRRIGDIIGVIDGIAFQTNILALNAAVEAARAGDQGRGFAVVASEVRSLAQRSADAAKEIKALIDGSTRTVDEGARLVDQAGNEIRGLVDSVGRVTTIMREIAAATEEQRAGIEQVNETVLSLDQATQQNAALVEEATAAARALEDQAQGLATAVGVFRLGSAGERTAGGARAATGPARSGGATRGVAGPPRAGVRPLRTAAPRQASRAPASSGDWSEF